MMLSLNRSLREISEGVDPRFSTVFHRSKKIFEPNDVPIKIRDIRVMNGETDVIKNEVDDLVIPIEHIKDALFAFSNLSTD